jgi:hypothetical protein
LPFRCRIMGLKQRSDKQDTGGQKGGNAYQHNYGPHRSR